jgi:hypothetical protein
MTDIEKIQKVVESIDGMCWHEAFTKNFIIPEIDCKKCGSYLPNPSSDSLDDLFDLAEKKGLADKITFEKNCVGLYECNFESDVVFYLGETRAQALLNALFNSIGE